MKRSLVVDDSRVIRKIAARLFEQLHFATDEAEDAKGALDAVRTKMPDAVLLDAQLPQRGEIEFLRALRRERGGSKPYVLYCTTENDVMHIAEALAAGANDFMLKPFNRAMLSERLSQAGLI